MAIFSVWNALDAVAARVRPPADSTAKASGFTEVYLPIDSCAVLDHSRARFDPPTTHDGHLRANFGGYVTIGPCASFANAILWDDVIEHEIGRK